MSIARIMQQAAAGAVGEALAIEDVFSTYLYTGNGSTQTITNGIDLSGEGGLVWIKNRTGENHGLVDTEVNGLLFSNLTNAANTGITHTFNNDGFTVGSSGAMNDSPDAHVSWTFRKAPRFFDVVTYTGTGSARTVSHNLGLAPGCIMVKKTSSVGDWRVYHRSNTANPETDYLQLNGTASTVDDNTLWNDTAPTATEFTVGTDANVNGNNVTYVAYLFAHDPLGPSGDGSDGLIACGSLVSGTVQDINLGWEPQFIIYKNASNTAGWAILDTMRGMTTDGSAAYVLAESSSAEATASAQPSPLANGFRWNYTGNSGNTFIYIAIRRGPMRQPTSGTEVFAIDIPATGVAAPTYQSGFPVDMALGNREFGAIGNNHAITRLTGTGRLQTNLTNAESADGDFTWGFMDGYYQSPRGNSTFISWMFRRAPGFFDVVAYSGTGSAQNISHNLGVVPELMIVKKRAGGTARAWAVYANNDNTDYLVLNTTAATADDNTYWNDTSPTASVFTVGTANSTNESGGTYIAYLFATLPGISKVGSYTGNGSSQTINCGFTGGARFVLIKRTDSTGDWLVGDTARGIVAGNDPYLELNSDAAEDTDEDWLDTDNSGFIVNETSTANANVNTATYIYLAIA